jgi:hypothetical protein
MERELVKKIIEITILLIVLVTIVVIKYPKIKGTSEFTGFSFLLLAGLFFIIGFIFSEQTWFIHSIALGLLLMSISQIYFIKSSTGFDKIQHIAFLIMLVGVFLVYVLLYFFK